MFIVMIYFRMSNVTRTEIFKCGDCGREFETIDAVQKHQVCHTREKPYKCSSCSYRASTQVRIIVSFTLRWIYRIVMYIE